MLICISIIVGYFLSLSVLVMLFKLNRLLKESEAILPDTERQELKKKMMGSMLKTIARMDKSNSCVMETKKNYILLGGNEEDFENK